MISFSKALAWLVWFSAYPVFHYNLPIPRPPRTIKGLTAAATNPSYQEKMKQIKHETVTPKIASRKIPRLSAVRPFKKVTSWVKKLVNMPGALFLESNQAIFFLTIDANSFSLTFAVSLSLPTLKHIFCIADVKPIPKQRKQKQIVHMFLYPL